MRAPVGVTVSKKSAARMASAWERRNTVQPSEVRCCHRCTGGVPLRKPYETHTCDLAVAHDHVIMLAVITARRSGSVRPDRILWGRLGRPSFPGPRRG